MAHATQPFHAVAYYDACPALNNTTRSSSPRPSRHGGDGWCDARSTAICDNNSPATECSDVQTFRSLPRNVITSAFDGAAHAANSTVTVPKCAWITCGSKLRTRRQKRTHSRASYPSEVRERRWNTSTSTPSRDRLSACLSGEDHGTMRAPLLGSTANTHRFPVVAIVIQRLRQVRGARRIAQTPEEVVILGARKLFAIAPQRARHFRAKHGRTVHKRIPVPQSLTNLLAIFRKPRGTQQTPVLPVRPSIAAAQSDAGMLGQKCLPLEAFRFTAVVGILTRDPFAVRQREPAIERPRQSARSSRLLSGLPLELCQCAQLLAAVIQNEKFKVPPSLLADRSDRLPQHPRRRIAHRHEHCHHEARHSRAHNANTRSAHTCSSFQ